MIYEILADAALPVIIMCIIYLMSRGTMSAEDREINNVDNPNRLD
jgi:hypothetical protein